MGTYNDSKIRTCRKARLCDSHKCRKRIAVGDQYLDYKMGQRNSFRLCMECAERERGNVACLPKLEVKP